MEGTIGDVPPKHHFIVKDGTRIKNLSDLYSSLQSMDDITFNHHVNDFKNDFHNWVRDIHKDNKLASNLLAAKSRKEMVEQLKKRVEELQNVKVAEAKVVKKYPRKQRRKRKIAEKPIKVPTRMMQPGKADILPEMPIAKPIETAIQNTLVQHPNLMKLTVGDFMLGLLIGAIAGIIIARII